MTRSLLFRQHDTQRSRVYAWERKAVRLQGGEIYTATWATLNEVQTWAAPIWRAERARYGKAGHAAPSIERPHRGQRRALAHYDGRITLPRWARNPWVVLHEMAHQLAYGDKHGPRFVGVLIGLASRHLGYDAYELMRQADAAGVKYAVRSIGSVPVFGTQARALQALQQEGPMSPMDLACWLSIGTAYEAVTERQIRAALLRPAMAGMVRLLRGRYHLRGTSEEAYAKLSTVAIQPSPSP